MNQGQAAAIRRLGSAQESPAIKFWIGASVLLGLAAPVFTYAVAIGSLRATDQAVAAALQAIWWQPLWPLFEAIAVAGGIELTSLIAAGLLLYLLRRRLWRDALALISLPAGLLLETLAKHIVSHPQPAVTHAGQLSVTRLVQGQVNSYPSGHMVRAIIVYGLVALTIHRLAPRGLAKRIAIPLATVLVAAIAFDRLYLAVHWASDVVGGFLLGGLSFSVAALWLALSASTGVKLNDED